MSSDRKKLYIISGSILAVLLIALFAPAGVGRILAALLLIAAAIISWFSIKKRIALSMNSKQVLLIITVIGLLYFVFYYVSALHFGFTKTGYGFKADIIFSLIIPIGTVIVCSEIVRYVLCAQKDIAASVFAYLICLTADIVICASVPGITTFSAFMDVVGKTLLPGILYNLLFNYLSLRYGFLPNMVYRALNVWVFYLIPYGSAISDSLVALINVILPIGIYYFIDYLYEKKRRYALQKANRFSVIASKILTCVVIVIMTGTVMLISNQFRFGALVIATSSMTGELNMGDVAIFERYDDRVINEGQVIVFEKSGDVVVHRVVDIQIINGRARYFTKGDANEDNDAGFIYDSAIVGCVDHKIPYIGYPTLWLRSLFAR